MTRRDEGTRQGRFLRGEPQRQRDAHASPGGPAPLRRSERHGLLRARPAEPNDFDRAGNNGLRSPRSCVVLFSRSR